MPIDGKSYIILGPFDVPPALSGGNLVTFILLEGVPYPRGDLGHSAVFDMGTGQCSGVTWQDALIEALQTQLIIEHRVVWYPDPTDRNLA